MRNLAILALALAALVVAGVAATAGLGPVTQESLIERRIYAYRDWQSVGLRVHADDVVTVRAQGTWLYTPGEYHGPEGHARYPSPSFYPVPNVAGGVLLARVGESGGPRVVSRADRFQVSNFGTLYFRINDDILGDNDGYVTVQVTVEQPEEETD